LNALFLPNFLWENQEADFHFWAFFLSNNFSFQALISVHQKPKNDE